MTTFDSQTLAPPGVTAGLPTVGQPSLVHHFAVSAAWLDLLADVASFE